MCQLLQHSFTVGWSVSVCLCANVSFVFSPCLMVCVFVYACLCDFLYSFPVCVDVHVCFVSSVSLRYYAEYYQQYQQLQQYPQYQYAYPSPNPLAAMPTLSTLPGVSAQQVATLDSLRPVLPAAPVPAAAAIAMATPRVYEPPPIPPSHKEPLLRRPELALHTPETPFR